MGALQNLLNKGAEGWKNLSNRRKVAVIVLAVGVISALLFFLVYLGTPKYEPLFLNMSPEDMGRVVEKLKQDKISYKLNGNAILVPEEQVEELRLSIVSSNILPSNGKGFELFDESRFGMTDTETRILYQRALETELERTIKAFDEVEYARVHLVIPETTVFVRDQEKASASVTLKLKSNRKLSPADVKTIISMVSASVKNLPKENVEVVDTNFNLLSENVINGDLSSPSSMNSRYDMKKQFDNELAAELKNILEPVFGPNRVKVTVNADLDFDSKEITSIKYDPEGIIKSQHKIMESSTNLESGLSGSPIDNNMSNTVPVGDNSTSMTRTEETTNYNISQVEEKIIKAPGQVKKLSTSVVIDGTLSDATKASVRNIVASAIGYDMDRGDLITVEGIPFDDTIKRRVESDIEEMKALQKEQERRNKLLMYIGYPLAALVGLILLIIIISRIRESRKRFEENKVDVVIGQPVAVSEVENKQSVLDIEEENSDLTSEIKKYASKKPDQVVEIVKAWLSEDER